LAAVCVRIPDSLTFDQAGTMLIPYFTAIHSMVNVGRVTKGQVSGTEDPMLFFCDVQVHLLINLPLA
jgi:NADPH:quinone reductase-like Zn-dependent oxidoreductase